MQFTNKTNINVRIEPNHQVIQFTENSPFFF